MKFVKWLAGVVTAVAAVLVILNLVEKNQEEKYIPMD